MKTVLNCFQNVSYFFLMAQTLHKRHYRKMPFLVYIKPPYIIHLEYENYILYLFRTLDIFSSIKAAHTKSDISKTNDPDFGHLI